MDLTIPRHEYRVVVIAVDEIENIKGVEASLNEEGDEGFRLVSTVVLGEGDWLVYTLMRSLS